MVAENELKQFRVADLDFPHPYHKENGNIHPPWKIMQCSAKQCSDVSLDSSVLLLLLTSEILQVKKDKTSAPR